MTDYNTHLRSKAGVYPLSSETARKSDMAVVLTGAVSASADAATPVAEHGYIPIPFACEVQSVYISQSGALTANATNYATFNVISYTAAGGDAATVAAKALDTPTTDDVVAKTGVELTVSDASKYCEAGGVLAFSVTKTGDGLATSAGCAAVTVIPYGDS